MAMIKICDKCKESGVSSKLILFHDEKHEHNGSLWTERKKTTYDLCDKCAMELALQIDKFADALIMECDGDDVE